MISQTDLFNNGFYNIKIANEIGLIQSIYMCEVLNNYNRELIKDRTTLTLAQQKEIDKELVNLGIATLNGDELVLDISKLIDNNDIKKQVKSAKSVSKQEAVNKAKTNKLKELIGTSNIQLRQAYYDWIDNVFARYGWLSTDAVKDAEELVSKYTNRTLDKSIEIIKIASKGAMRDMQWAIDKYEELGGGILHTLPQKEVKWSGVEF